MPNNQCKSGIADQSNNIKMLKTRSGHTLTFDDTDGKESITLEDKNGNSLLIDTKNKSITLSAGQKISLNAKEIEIIGDNKVTISTKEFFAKGSSKTIIESDSTTEIKSQSKVTVGGQAGVELSGAKVDVKAEAQANIKSAMVNIN